MALVNVGNWILNLEEVAIAHFVDTPEETLTLILVSGYKQVFMGKDAHLIWGLLQNQVAAGARKEPKLPTVNRERWAIASQDDRLVNRHGILEANCENPMIFDSATLAMHWIRDMGAGTKTPLSPVSWSPFIITMWAG